MSKVHYYASSAMYWATGETRAETLAKLAEHHGSDRIKRSIDTPGSPGIYCWSCKVHAPSDAEYVIENYMPKGVETSESIVGYIVNLKGAMIIEDSKALTPYR